MHRTFTSGAARRAEVTSRYVYAPMIIEHGPDGELEFRTEADVENDAMAEQVNARHDKAGLINPILDVARDTLYSGDSDLGSHLHEWLFQLARIWSEWQSPRIGTFPLDYRDPCGQVTREQSEESGEDRAYWEIDDALARAAGITDEGPDRWDQPEASAQLLRGYSDSIQDYIAHATAVLSRLSNFHPLP
jgi:hypothetical protein